MLVQLLNSVRSLQSIRARNHDRWRRLHVVKHVVFVGSSCGGKSTIIDAIRQVAALPALRIRIPVRYVTRPARQADNFTENRHVTPEQFEEAVRRGEIGLSWVRKMEAGRQEQYGFESVPPGQLAIYSANNAIYDNPESIQPRGAIDDALFIGVFAPDSIRRERLLRRSPDLLTKRPEEVQYRLGDSSANMLPHVHLVVRNYGHFERIAATEVVTVLMEIVAANRSAEAVSTSND